MQSSRPRPYYKKYAFTIVGVVGFTLLNFTYHPRQTTMSNQKHLAIISPYLRAANDAAAQRPNQYQSNKSEKNAIEEGPYRLLQDYDGRIEPLWSCTSKDANQPHRKLVFIHIFKTAGSTFRSMLERYSKQCSKGFAVLIHCSNLSPESMETYNEAWTNAQGVRCQTKTSLARDGSSFPIPRNGKMNNALLSEHIDVVIGHAPIGLHQNWKTSNQQEVVDAQYVAYFRDPIQKYVSGYLHSNRKRTKKLTFNEIVKRIVDKVMDERSKNEYNAGYSAYLLTPQQKTDNLSLQARNDMILDNLVRMQVLVGTVERMTESAATLQYVLDGKRMLMPLFELVSGTDAGAGNSTNAPNRIIKNRSTHVSTSDVVKALTQNETFASILEEYLKYDKEVYQFAFQMQQRQYSWLTTHTKQVQ
jgi:hypothetical protein